MSLKRRVGHRIKLARLRRGLSQEDLAEHLDRSVAAVSNIERGRTLPSFVTLERLARALDIPVRDFFDFGPEADDNNPKRSRLVTELVEATRHLSDADLEVALELVQALHRGRPRTRRR